MKQRSSWRVLLSLFMGLTMLLGSMPLAAAATSGCNPTSLAMSASMEGSMSMKMDEPAANPQSLPAHKQTMPCRDLGMACVSGIGCALPVALLQPGLSIPVAHGPSDPQWTRQIAGPDIDIKPALRPPIASI